MYDTTSPHILVDAETGLVGFSFRELTVVQIATTLDPELEPNPDTLYEIYGVLPTELIGNCPHVKHLPTTITGDRGTCEYIPLPDAPEWYLKRVRNEYDEAEWIERADVYCRHTEATELESIVLSMAESFDTIGSGQVTRIANQLDIPEEEIQEIITDLQLSKVEKYRRTVEAADDGDGPVFDADSDANNNWR
jgi:hypothetical protein